MRTLEDIVVCHARLLIPLKEPLQLDIHEHQDAAIELLERRCGFTGGIDTEVRHYQSFSGDGEYIEIHTVRPLMWAG